MTTIVMTGGTSGIGAIAAERMTRRPGNARLIVGARETTSVGETIPLLRLLFSVLADTATVVLTTSGTDDRDTKAGLLPPRHADAELLAHPDRDPDRDARPRKSGEHAYTASKLCTVLTARSLSEHADARARRLTVIAYDPGQVFGTGLAKDPSELARRRDLAQALWNDSATLVALPN